MRASLRGSRNIAVGKTLMDDDTKLDSSSPRDAAKDRNDELQRREASRGRGENIIAFGVVALVSMIFGFLIGLIF
jgi:hypothetical protein